MKESSPPPETSNSVYYQGRLMKALTRIPIFGHNTIATTLLTDTKSLEIKFRKNYLTAESLLEFENILAWSAIHHEVQSLFITCYGDHFIQGFDQEELKILTEDQLKKLFFKMSTITQSIMCLPQTVVMDLRQGARGIGLELALAADIRLASSEASFCFDYLTKGLTPVCGLFSFLKPYLNQSILRSLLLSSKDFNIQTLNLLGGWCEIGMNQKEITNAIYMQAPVARMQAKRGLLGDTFNEGSAKTDEEKQIFHAVTLTKDYTKDQDFMSSHAYKEILQAAGL
jgi:enoyl-CoA hydratase/carnithine racemase